MKNIVKLLAPLALVGLSAFVAPSVAEAETSHSCQMKGSWGTEDFMFMATYVERDGGGASLTGLYADPAAGSTANVTGALLAGTWAIKLTYTDPKHPGWIKDLVGQGTRDPATQILTVKGTFTLKKGATGGTGNGNFTMAGQCKKN